jgi:hypothetical protein
MGSRESEVYERLVAHFGIAQDVAAVVQTIAMTDPTQATYLAYAYKEHGGRLLAFWWSIVRSERASRSVRMGHTKYEFNRTAQVVFAALP